jgi:hypothetical protein
MKLKNFVCLFLLLCFYSNISATDPIIIGQWYNDNKTSKSAMYFLAGTEFIELIANNTLQKGTVNAILYKLENKKKRTTISVIKPHLYAVLADKKMGKELLPDNIPLAYLEEKGKEVVLRIDISKYKISLPPEGVFVGLEYMGEVKSITDKDIDTGFDNSPFGIFYSNTTIYTTDDVCYSKWQGRISENDPRNKPLCSLFGIEVK